MSDLHKDKKICATVHIFCSNSISKSRKNIKHQILDLMLFTQKVSKAHSPKYWFVIGISAN